MNVENLNLSKLWSCSHIIYLVISVIFFTKSLVLFIISFFKININISIKFVTFIIIDSFFN